MIRNSEAVQLDTSKWSKKLEVREKAVPTTMPKRASPRFMPGFLTGFMPWFHVRFHVRSCRKWFHAGFMSGAKKGQFQVPEKRTKTIYNKHNLWEDISLYFVNFFVIYNFF